MTPAGGLVERLRASGALMWNGDADDKGAAKALHEAADAIESLTAQLADAARLREELERKLRIAELKNQGTLANNLCPDHRDKQTHKPCLACTIEKAERELAEARAELGNIAHAKRFDRECFPDDTGFADWAQSRCRFRLAEQGAQGKVEP